MQVRIYDRVADEMLKFNDIEQIDIEEDLFDIIPKIGNGLAFSKEEYDLIEVIVE